MTDTHTHIYMPDEFPDGAAEAARRALEAGVSRMVLPCVGLDSIGPMRELQARFPAAIRLALGLHPSEVEEDFEAALDRMEAMLPGEFSAIGEVGIDLYHDASSREGQKRAFRRQLGWARRFGLPVIIHCRDGLDDVLGIVAGAGESLPTLIFHSFTGGREDVRRIREVCDPMFGINGVVTFKNAPALRDALPEIGLGRLLLETDSPYLSPAPLRGRRNESARLPYIRDCVASTLAAAGVKDPDGRPVTPQFIETVTDASAAAIFGFS